MKKIISILGLIGLLQILGQIIIQILIIRTIGFTNTADIFFISQSIPFFITAVLTSSFQNVWIHKFSSLSHKKEALKNSQISAQTQSLVVVIILSFIVVITQSIWFPLIYPLATNYQVKQGGFFIFIFMVIGALNLLTNLLIMQMRAVSNFLKAEIVSLAIIYFIVILMAIFLPKYSVNFTLLFLLARAIINYLVFMSLCNWPFFSIKSINHNREVWVMIKHTMLGGAINKTMPIIDKYWAAIGPPGNVTIFNLSQTSIAALIAIFEKMLCIPVIPNFVRLFNKGKYNKIRELFRETILKISALTIFFSFIFFLSHDVIAIFLQWLLKIDRQKTNEILSLCIFFIGYLWAATSIIVLVAVFYSFKDAKTPMLIGIITFIIGFCFKFFLYNKFGLPLLAISNSIYFVMNAVILYLLLEIKLNQLIKKA